MRARGNNIGAGERNRGTRHPPRAPNLHGRWMTGRIGYSRNAIAPLRTHPETCN